MTVLEYLRTHWVPMMVPIGLWFASGVFNALAHLTPVEWEEFGKRHPFVARVRALIRFFGLDWPGLFKMMSVLAEAQRKEHPLPPGFSIPPLDPLEPLEVPKEKAELPPPVKPS